MCAQHDILSGSARGTDKGRVNGKSAEGRKQPEGRKRREEGKAAIW